MWCDLSCDEINLEYKVPYAYWLMTTINCIFASKKLNNEIHYCSVGKSDFYYRPQ